MTTGPDMLKASYGHCGAIRKSTRQVFFVGGRGPWTSYNDFITGTQIFNMGTKTFSLLPSHMSVGRVYSACAVLEDKDILIIAGGQSTNWDHTDSVEILNLNTETWTNARAAPVAGSSWAAGEFLFMLWNSTTLYQYDEIGDQWYQVEDVPFDLSILKPYYVQVENGGNSFCPYV